jgi:hypothetical protein
MMRQQLDRCRLETSVAIPSTFQPAITSSFSIACFLRLKPFPLPCSRCFDTFRLHLFLRCKPFSLNCLSRLKSIASCFYLHSFRLLTAHSKHREQAEDANDCRSAEFLL